MWRYTYSAILCIGFFLSAAQDQETVEEILSLDSIPRFAIREVGIHYNLLKPIESFVNPEISTQEIQAEVGINRFFLVLDMGFSNTSRGDSFQYTSEGSYWRAGIDANMSTAWRDGNMIGLGLRYCRASYDERINFDDTNVLSETTSVTLQNTDMGAQWGELVFKIRGEIQNNLYAGYTMRYQFFQTIDERSENLETYDIPGFGRTFQRNSFGFDFYIGYKCDFR